MAAPAYDLILLGATGFTGRLVAEYLLERYGVDAELRWAIAGRSATKLEALRRELQGEKPAKALPILVADNHDAESLEQLVLQTRVICSTVGPYAQHGTLLVEACADSGT